jgi:hypothetical protein
MIDTTEFVKQLREKVKWDSKNNFHWSRVRKVNGGLEKLPFTNKQMMVACSHYYGRKYNMLSYREKKLVREDVFRKLRGEVDG